MSLPVLTCVHVHASKLPSNDKVCITFRTIDQVTHVYSVMVRQLGQHNWPEKKMNTGMALVEMYHDHLDSVSEDVLPRVFATKTYTVRCMVATIAFLAFRSLTSPTSCTGGLLPHYYITGRRLADVAGTGSLPRLYCTSLLTALTRDGWPRTCFVTSLKPVLTAYARHCSRLTR